MGDVFKSQSEAGEQYSYPYSHWKSDKKVHPNPAFDLSRLSCSIIEELYSHGNIPKDISSKKIHKYQNVTDSKFYNMITEWITDCYGKPINRFQQFDLYKMIARRMKCTVPLKQMRRPHFRQFCISKYNFNKNHNNSNSLSYHITAQMPVSERQKESIEKRVPSSFCSNNSNISSDDMLPWECHSNTSSINSEENYFTKDVHSSLNLPDIEQWRMNR